LLNYTAVFFLTLPIAFGQTALTTAQIAKRASPTVVVIQGKTDSGEIQGSGFIVSNDGKIVTNLHVIRDMKSASVQLANGRVLDTVMVRATDERRDLAIIQVSGFGPKKPEGDDLDQILDSIPQLRQVLELGNSDTLTVGEPVVVVGSPLGLESTVTAGILSAIRDLGDGSKLLQTDAAVNHGNSGGPLVNANGQAVGVVSSILRSDSAQGLNFAIPINYVRDLLNKLHPPVKLGQMTPYSSKPPIPIPPPTTKQNGGPSLSDTFKWLNENLDILTATHYVATLRGEPTDVDVHFSSNAFQNQSTGACFLFVTQYETRKSKRNPQADPLKIVSGFSLPLSRSDISVQPEVERAHYDGSEAQGYMVSIEAKANAVTFYPPYDTKLPVSAPQRALSEHVNKGFLIFGDESAARRVRDALSHAADICRKNEPF
jgi:hypothetical protein